MSLTAVDAHRTASSLWHSKFAVPSGGECWASGRERNESITLGGFFLDFQGMGYKREELLISGFTTASKRMHREHGFL